jgi:glyoxylase-like metal-dependent hydrolase (beta-lactamase superfamily II)
VTASPAPSEDWTAPTVEQVAPGVHRIPLPLPNDGLKAVNVYALEEPGGLVLVDSGWAVPEGRARLEEGLGRLGAGLGDIRRFLVTHLHRDHYSLGAVLRRELGTRLSLGAGEAPSLEVLRTPSRLPLQHQVRQLQAAGASDLAGRLAALRGEAPADPLPWDPPDDWLHEGDLLLDSGRTLAVVETPGHTRGHVVFRSAAEGLLFAGDHVLPTITPSIGFEPAPSEDPLGEFLASLAKVRRLPDSRLLPAHGPVAESVHARVDELTAHHGRRLDQTEAAVRAGAETVAQVAAALRWTRRERHLDELDVFNQMLAVGETWAHLRLLEAQGRVRSALDDQGTRRYQLATP